MNMNFNSYHKYQIVTKFLSDGLAVLVTFKTKAERDPVSVRSTLLDPILSLFSHKPTVTYPFALIPTVKIMENPPNSNQILPLHTNLILQCINTTYISRFWCNQSWPHYRIGGPSEGPSSTPPPPHFWKKLMNFFLETS